jgi:hypothetical protein
MAKENPEAQTCPFPSHTQSRRETAHALAEKIRSAQEKAEAVHSVLRLHRVPRD